MGHLRRSVPSTGVAKVPVMPCNPWCARLRTDSRSDSCAVQTYAASPRCGAMPVGVGEVAVPPQPLRHPAPRQHCYDPVRPRSEPRRAPASVIGSLSASRPVSALYGSPSGHGGWVLSAGADSFHRKGLRGIGRKVSVMPIRGCVWVVTVTKLAYGESPRQATTHRRVT